MEEQLASLFAVNFVSCPPIDPFCASAPKDYPILKVFDDDGVARLVEQRGLFRDSLIREMPLCEINHASHHAHGLAF